MLFDFNSNLCIIVVMYNKCIMIEFIFEKLN